MTTKGTKVKSKQEFDVEKLFKVKYQNLQLK